MVCRIDSVHRIIGGDPKMWSLAKVVLGGNRLFNNHYGYHFETVSQTLLLLCLAIHR
jgi:hypothetical protein